MAGGAMASTRASFKSAVRFLTSAITPCTCSALLLRMSQCLSKTKRVPTLDLFEKVITFRLAMPPTVRMAGMLSRRSMMVFNICTLRVVEVASGISYVTKNRPSSSVGMKPPGLLVNRKNNPTNKHNSRMRTRRVAFIHL